MMVTSIFSPLSRDRHMSWVNHKIMESVAYLGYSVSYKKKLYQSVPDVDLKY